MWTYIFYFLLAYSLYQLVFKFIIPIYRTTKQVKKGFREMQERMQQPSGQQHHYASSANAQTKVSREQQGDYIDFEEVKE